MHIFVFERMHTNKYIIQHYSIVGVIASISTHWSAVEHTSIKQVEPGTDLGGLLPAGNNLLLPKENKRERMRKKDARKQLNWTGPRISSTR